MEKKRTSLTTQKLLALLSLALLVLFFSIMNPAFRSVDNAVAILLATCVNGILALGVTFVIITGGIDLSLGTVMTFSAVMGGIAITKWNVPILFGVIFGILTGGFCGFISGFSISKLKLPPFIATMGMMMITKGLSIFITGAVPIYFNKFPAYNAIALGSIMGIPQLYNAILIYIAMCFIAWIFLSKTIVGRYCYAIGSNEEAVRLSGVKVTNWKILLYSLCGAFAGMAGIVMTSRLTSVQPGLGSGYELEAIAAAVIGGTSLSGGEGGIQGTIIGAFIMSVLTNGLRILSVKQELQSVVIGFVLMLAVYLDIVRRDRAARAV
jgi:ribose transport system permease protein